MIAKIGEERGGVCGGMNVVVECELSERQVIDPIVLLCRDVGPKIGF